MAAKKKNLAIVIPAYNEAKVIAGVVKDIEAVFKNRPHYLIVVNDGSSDRTAQILSKKSHILLINHLLNSGAGAATRTGLNFARTLNCDQVATMDADGQHSARDLLSIIEKARKSDADLVIGSRLIYSKGMPWYRVFGNKALSLLTFMLFGVFVTDSQSGLKVLNKNAQKHIKFYSNNFAFCSEMIYQAHKHRLKIKELPIEAIYSDYSLAKGQSNWNGFNIVRQMLKRRLLDFING